MTYCKCKNTLLYILSGTVLCEVILAGYLSLFTRNEPYKKTKTKLSNSHKPKKKEHKVQSLLNNSELLKNKTTSGLTIKNNEEIKQDDHYKEIKKYYVSFYFSNENTWGRGFIDFVDNETKIDYFVSLTVFDIAYLIKWAKEDTLIEDNEQLQYNKCIQDEKDIKLLYFIMLEYYESLIYKTSLYGKNKPNENEIMIIEINISSVTEEEKKLYRKLTDYYMDEDYNELLLTGNNSILNHKISLATKAIFPN